MIMENKKDKVALNDELLEKVAGGNDDDESWKIPEWTPPLCPGCGGPLNNGICIDPTCSRSPIYEDGNDIVIHDSIEVAPHVRP